MMQRLAALLIASLLAAGTAFSQTTLSPEEARLAAAQLLAKGQPRAAAAVTEVLIRRDKNDAAALILHAHAMRQMDRPVAAQAAARHAWQRTERPIEKYGAALAMAQALASDDKKTRAQIWLRRAAEVAPDQHAHDRAARDYRYVRATNPWSVQFSFGISPSDNVNNAPRDNTIVLGGLVFTNPTAVPIAGVEVWADTNLRYNFDTRQTSRNFVAFRWSESQVYFTDDNVPLGVEESDYAFRRLQLSLGRDFQSGPDKPRQSVAVSFGKLWSGGDSLANELKLSLLQSYDRPKGRRFSWRGELGYSERLDSSIRSGVTAALGANWHRPLANGGYLTWNAALNRNNSGSSALAHTRLSFGVNYTPKGKILGAQPSFGGSFSLSDYDHPLYSPEPRRDTSVKLSASLLFVDFDTYGFAPKLTVEARDTTSNITRFETRNIGLQIGFQSLF